MEHWTWSIVRQFWEYDPQKIWLDHPSPNKMTNANGPEHMFFIVFAFVLWRLSQTQMLPALCYMQVDDFLARLWNEKMFLTLTYLTRPYAEHFNTCRTSVDSVKPLPCNFTLRSQFQSPSNAPTARVASSPLAQRFSTSFPRRMWLPFDFQRDWTYSPTHVRDRHQKPNSTWLNHWLHHFSTL